MSTQRLGTTDGRVTRGNEAVPDDVVATGVVTVSVEAVVAGVSDAFLAISIVFRLSYNEIISDLY